MPIEHTNLQYMADICTSTTPEERPTFQEILKKLILDPDRFKDYIQFNNNENKLDIIIFPAEDESNVDNSNDGNTDYCFNNINKDEFFNYVELILKSYKKQNEEEAELKWKQTIDICERIFIEKTNSIKKTAINNPLLQNICKLIPDDSQITEISNNIRDVFYLDKMAKFDMIPDNFFDNLKIIIHNGSLFKESFEICCLYIFYAWISFNIKIAKQVGNLDVSVLLSALNCIIQNNQFCSEKKHYYDIATDCFSNFIEIITTNRYISDYTNVLKEITIFFDDIQILHKYAEKIIYSISIEIFNDTDLEPQEKDLILLISNVLAKERSILKPNFISLVVKIKSNYLRVVTNIFDSFCLFSNLFKIVDFKLYDHLLLSAFNNLLFEVSNIKKSKSFFVQPKNSNFEPVKMDKIEINFPDSFDLPFDIDQLKNVINKEIKSPYPKAKQLFDFFQKNFSNQIFIFKEVIISNSNCSNEVLKYVEKIFSEFTFKNEKSYYQILILFYICQSLKEKNKNQEIHLSENIIDIIYDINICQNFDDYSIFDVINSLRDFLFNDCFNVRIQLLQKYSKCPNLLYEILTRLINNQNIYYDLRLIVDALSLLHKYRIMDNNDPIKDLKLAIRSNLFNYLVSFAHQKLNENNNDIEILFDSDNFINDYFDLLLEPPIIHELVIFMHFYLKNLTDKSKINNILEIIKNIIKYSISKLLPDNALSLISNIISALSNANKNQTVIECLKTKSLIFKEVLDIDVSSCIKKSVNAFIESFLKIFNLIKINKDEIDLVIDVINHYFPFSNQVYNLNNIFQFNLINEYEIKSAEILCALIKLGLKTKLIISILIVISDLCSKSTEICIKCHKTQIDILIIKIINDWKKKIINVIPGSEYFYDEKDHEITVSQIVVELLLEVFVKISIFVSSATVVQDFFSMLCPIDNAKHLSLIHENMLKSLNNILIESKKYQFAPLPMVPSNTITISPIHKNTFKNDEGISFVFWISLPSLINDFKYRVFMLKPINESERQILMIYIKNKNIYVEIKSKEVHFDMNIPSNT